MKLKFIKAKDNCPTCGAELVGEGCEYREGKIREHVNGGRWEYKTYACGSVIMYVPNFERDEVHIACPKTPEIVVALVRRKHAISKIDDIFSKIEVDDDFKDAVLRTAKGLI